MVPTYLDITAGHPARSITWDVPQPPIFSETRLRSQMALRLIITSGDKLQQLPTQFPEFHMDAKDHDDVML
jgi:hypothetical protein